MEKSSDMQAVYRKALTQAEAELARHEKRGKALKDTVAALKGLLVGRRGRPPGSKTKKTATKATAKRGPGRPPKKAAAKAKRAAAKTKPKGRPGRKRQIATGPDVPPGSFKGMGPTAAYRRFVEIFGDKHGFSVPQVSDTLTKGGVKTKSINSLRTGLYNAMRKKKAGAKKAK